MDIKKRISLMQHLNLLGESRLSNHGIEVVVCYLEDDNIHQINTIKALKEEKVIVLGVGMLPFSSVNRKTKLASLKRAQLLQRASDGCILFNKDAFIGGERNLEEVNAGIEQMVSHIEKGLLDILKDGIINVDIITLKEALRDCGTFMVSYGDGGGLDRVGLAFLNAYESVACEPLSYKKFNLNTARTLIIKILLSKGDTLSTAELSRLGKLVRSLPQRMNVIVGIGNSDELEKGKIQIVMLGTEVDAELNLLTPNSHKNQQDNDI